MTAVDRAWIIGFVLGLVQGIGLGLGLAVGPAALSAQPPPSSDGDLDDEDEDLDDLDDIARSDLHRTDDPGEVPHRLIGLTLAVGGVVAQTPLSGDLGLTLGIRPMPGLRLDAELGSWLGTARLPGTVHIVPVSVPRVGAGVAFEAATRAAARPWIGAGLAIAVAASDPVAAAPILTGRAGVDVGRKYLAWTFAASGGVMICPALPAIAGPTYRAVAPVFSAQTGPSVRL